MKWKANTNTEAAEILKMLARQGEPLLKKLDQGVNINLLAISATNDEGPDTVDSGSTDDNRHETDHRREELAS